MRQGRKDEGGRDQINMRQGRLINDSKSRLRQNVQEGTLNILDTGERRYRMRREEIQNEERREK